MNEWYLPSLHYQIDPQLMTDVWLLVDQSVGEGRNPNLINASCMSWLIHNLGGVDWWLGDVTSSRVFLFSLRSDWRLESESFSVWPTARINNNCKLGNELWIKRRCTISSQTVRPRDRKKREKHQRPDNKTLSTFPSLRAREKEKKIGSRVCGRRMQEM